MRKIYLLLSVLLFACGYAFSQTSHTESFDGTAYPPAGWTLNGIYGTLTYFSRVTSSTSETATPHSGAAFSKTKCVSGIPSGGSGNLFTPKIDYTNRGGNTPTVSVWVFRDLNPSYTTAATYDAEGITVYANTTTSSSFTGGTALGFIPRRGGLAASGTYLTTSTNLTISTAGWYQYSFNIPATYTVCAYVGFKFTSKAGRNIYIDDVDYTSYPATVPGCATISSPANGGTGFSPINPSLTLNWTAPAACAEISGYKLYLGTDAGATNIINGTNIGIVTTYTTSALAANTTYYWKVVPTNALGDATGCSIWSFTTGAANPGCSAVQSCTGCMNSVTNTDWITDVYMGSISRTTPTWAEGYVNTGLSTNVVIGTNYTLNVYTTDNGPGNTNYIFVYVDWNQDGDFQDANETITTYASPGSNITINPPSGALAGSSVMRIMQHDGEGWDPSPAGCGDMYYGEVEDYYLNICATQVTTQPASTYTLCATIGTQTLTAVTNAATSHQWQYCSTSNGTYTNVTNGTPAGAVYSGATTPTMTISGISTASTYYYKLKVVGAACTAYSSYTSLTVRSISVDPTSLTAPQYTICPGNSTTLTRTGGTLGYGASWKWYTGSCGGTLLSSTSSATLAVTPSVTTTYYLRAEGICNNSNCVSATIVVGGAPTSNPVSTTATTPICNGGSTTLTVTNPTTIGAGSAWVWYSGSCGGTYVGTGNPLVTNPTVTTTYYVRAEGCNITSCVSRAVTVNNIPACNTLTYPANTATGICRSPTLTWNTSAGATGYKLYVGTDAAATNIINGTNVGNVTSYTLPVLTASTLHYWKVVPTNSCGDASGCSIRSFTTSTIPCYCTANQSCTGCTNSTTGTDWINGVYIGSISRSTPSWAEGYVNTGLSNNVVVGTGQSLWVYTTDNGPGNTNYIFVYVDWNQDGDFQDANESITTYSSPGNNITVTPPTGALPGSTVMRIMQRDNEGWDPSPAGCGDMYYGEVEDYILTVCPTQVVTEPASSYSLCATIATQTLSAVTTGATSHQWQYCATSNGTYTNVVNGTPAGAVYTGATTPTMTISGITNASTYYYKLKVVGASCTAYSAYTSLTVRSISTDPTSLTAPQYTICPGNSTTLTRNGGSLGYGASWKWYTGSCGGTLISSTSGALVVTPSVTTTYYVRAQGTCNNSNCVSATIVVGGTPNTAATSATASSTAICNGGSTTLTANGGALGTWGSWQWYSGSCGGTYVGSGNPITVSPTVSTTYYVRAEGCDITSCVGRTISVNNVPSANTMTAPSNGATGQCRNFQLTWNSTSNVSGYKLYLGTDAAATNILNGVNQGFTYSYQSVTMAANTTYYWKVVPWNSCGDATGTTIRSFTTGNTICYCNTYGGTGYNYIDYVSIGSINNSSSDWGYADYSSQSTVVVIGTGYPLTVYSQGDTINNYCRVFVDWNQDGDFTDVGELVLDNWSDYYYSTTIVPPTGAAGGMTRMRIMLSDDYWGYNSPDGCGNTYAGETEDYSLNVCLVEITAQPANTAACASSGSGTLSLTANGASSYQWQYKNGASWANVVNGTPAGSVYTNQTTANLTVAGISSIGNYLYRCNVVGTCTVTSNTCTLTVINTVPSTAAYTFPSNGAINQCATSFTSLNWNAASNSPASYKLYFGTNAAANNIVNGTNIGNVLTYNPLPLATNTTYYWKVVPTNNCGDASGAPTYSFTTGTTCYCVPNYTSNGCNLSMYISNFSTTGGSLNITNASSCVPAFANYYADYSSMNVQVISGNAFNFSVSQPSLTYNMGFRIWIDYNNDFDFADAGEDVWNSGSTGKTFTGTIIVPAGTPAGVKRMRVRNKYNGVPLTTDYCSTLSYGETEDYGLIVVAPCTAPTTQATSLVLSGATCTQMNASWTNGSGTKRIVVAKANSAVSGTPANSTTYTANSVFGTGGFISPGEYVVYNGTGNSVTVTGLTAGATYYFKVFEYNCTPGWEEFLTTSPPTGSLPTSGSTPPSAGPNQYLCSGTTSTTMAGSGTGTWTQVSGPNTPNIVSQTNPITGIGTTTGLVSGTYIFRWTGPCGNIYDDIMIIIQ